MHILSYTKLPCAHTPANVFLTKSIQQISVVMHITVPHSNMKKMYQTNMISEENHTTIDWLSYELIIMDSEKFCAYYLNIIIS